MAMNIRRTWGRTLSHTSTSFAKRFKILPSGVTSKNVIGRRRTALNNMECIPFAAAIVPSENVIDTMHCARTRNAKWIHYRAMTMMSRARRRGMRPNVSEILIKCCTICWGTSIDSHLYSKVVCGGENVPADGEAISPPIKFVILMKVRFNEAPRGFNRNWDDTVVPFHHPNHNQFMSRAATMKF